MEEWEALLPEAHTTAQLRVYFGFRPNDKGEPSNVEEAICEISHKKVPVKSANATNLSTDASSPATRPTVSECSKSHELLLFVMVYRTLQYILLRL